MRFWPMSRPFWRIIFASSPTRHVPSLAATASANSAFGSSSAMRALLRSMVRCAAMSARAMRVEPSSVPSLATYAPSRRRAGSTSCVTQRLKA